MSIYSPASALFILRTDVYKRQEDEDAWNQFRSDVKQALEKE